MSLRVYLLAETKLTDGIQQFLADRDLHWRQDDAASDGEHLVEAAGRVCYLSFSERQYRSRNDEYISNLIAQGHDSVLEHATFSILADGISRNLSHQLVRHRIGFSYSELSQQYFEIAPPRWAMPVPLEHDAEAREEWSRLVSDAQQTYDSLLSKMSRLEVLSALSRKEANRLVRATARSVLPGCVATTLVVTGNARAWRHFLRVRGTIAGDLEMREYCSKVLEVLSSSAGNLFADFEVTYDSLGPMVRIVASTGASSEEA